jgi:metal-sulfur cluster biosynthetic enzyme
MAPGPALAQPFDYEGDPALRAPLEAALRRVVDPEMVVNIVDLGLVYGIEARPGHGRVRLTMTSAACPVAEVIVDDVGHAMQRVLGDDADVAVDLVWDPPWGPGKMSDKARHALGWED